MEQLSQKYAVSQETIESWRAQGLEALEHGLGNGSGGSAEAREALRQLERVKAALTRPVMEKELLQQALEAAHKKRPTPAQHESDRRMSTHGTQRGVGADPCAKRSIILPWVG